MSAIYNRNQIGPMTMPELIALFKDIVSNPTSKDSIINSMRETLSVKQNKLQKETIRHVFDPSNSNRGMPAWNDGILKFLDQNDIKFEGNNPERTPDWLACYYPWNGMERRSGIYFFSKRIHECIEKQPTIDVSSFLRAIAIHELFHYFVERFCFDKKGYNNHLCSPYCNIEEAAANYAAYQDAQSDMSAIATYKDLLFREKSQGGHAGYGEYGLIDERIFGVIEYLKLQVPTCTHPSDYLNVINELPMKPELFGQGGPALWQATLENALNGNIAFYYDMIN